MFEPEPLDQEQFAIDVMMWAKIIFEMQNENPLPESGTMGFIMGCAMALGNGAAVYCTGQTRQQRKQFEKIVVRMVTDSFRSPMATGSLEGETLQ